MEIHVTQQHIDDGERCDHYGCAISLALKDAGIPLGVTYKDGHGRMGVDNYQINCPDEYTIPLTKEMQQFIVEFDHDRASTKPITFEFPDATFQAVKVQAPADLVTV